LAKVAAAQKPEAQGSQEESGDSPLLYSLNAAVKKMVTEGKAKGHVTYDNLNKALPPDQVSSEQIEDTMSMLSEMGINVVENEDGEEAAPAKAAPEGDSARAQKGNVDEADRAAPTTRSACTCAKWVRSNYCRGKAKLLSPSALKPVVK